MQVLDRLDYERIGIRIRKQRELLRLTQKELANRMKISKSFLNEIEMGKKCFSVNYLAEFCSVLKLPANYILYGSGRFSEKHEALFGLLRECSEEKIILAEKILKLFLKSHEQQRLEKITSN